eukprot:m51a1_g12885 hypothetical protein (288) ;mRNA; f:164-1027
MARPSQELLELMIDSGANVNASRSNGASALYTAAWNGNEETIVSLCKRGADVNCHNTKDWTPLHAAAFRGHLNACRALIEHGALLDLKSREGTTALYYACDGRRTAVAEFLLDRGANPNVSELGGWLPVHACVLSNNMELLQRLLDKGALLNVPNRHLKAYTPLHMAISQTPPNAAAVRLMLGRGADPNAANSNGNTAVHLAIHFGLDEVVRMLCTAGRPDLARRNRFGKTPLEMACSLGMEATARFLAERAGVQCPPVGHVRQPRKADRPGKATSAKSIPPDPDHY